MSGASAPLPVTPPVSSASKSKPTSNRLHGLRHGAYTWRPIIIACLLTTLLMSLTIATYVGDAFTDEDATVPNTDTAAQQAPTSPMTQSDIDQAVEFTNEQITTLKAVPVPSADDLAEAALGL